MPLLESLLQRPALLALKLRVVELAFGFAHLPATVQAEDKLIELNHSFVGSNLTRGPWQPFRRHNRGNVQLRLWCRLPQF
eukprot:584155-Amphidinium_carterae.2